MESQFKNVKGTFAFLISLVPWWSTENMSRLAYWRDVGDHMGESLPIQEQLTASQTQRCEKAQPQSAEPPSKLTGIHIEYRISQDPKNHPTDL